MFKFIILFLCVFTITNAIRFKRQIGKQSLQKHWVCYEQDFELFTQISKDSTFAP